MDLFGVDEGKTDLKKRNKVIIPLDTLVLLMVVVVLLLTLVFSLGVERGRRIVANTNNAGDEAGTADTGNFTAMAADRNLAAAPAEVKEEKSASVEQKIIEEKPPAAASQRLNQQQDKRYIIQVATYVKEAIALAEAEQLKKQGYAVSVSKKGNFIVLFIGEFTDREQAQKNMQVLRNKYKDCFIRRL